MVIGNVFAGSSPAWRVLFMSKDNTKVANVEEEKNKKKYYFSPKYCSVCGERLPYEERHYDTCSIECSKRLCAKLVWEGLI